jgi:hypothetical protein
MNNQTKESLVFWAEILLDVAVFLLALACVSLAVASWIVSTEEFAPALIWQIIVSFSFAAAALTLLMRSSQVRRNYADLLKFKQSVGIAFHPGQKVWAVYFPSGGFAEPVISVSEIGPTFARAYRFKPYGALYLFEDPIQCLSGEGHSAYEVDHKLRVRLFAKESEARAASEGTFP